MLVLLGFCLPRVLVFVQTYVIPPLEVHSIVRRATFGRATFGSMFPIVIPFSFLHLVVIFLALVRGFGVPISFPLLHLRVRLPVLPYRTRYCDLRLFSVTRGGWRGL